MGDVTDSRHSDILNFFFVMMMCVPLEKSLKGGGDVSPLRNSLYGGHLIPNPTLFFFKLVMIRRDPSCVYSLRDYYVTA